MHEEVGRVEKRVQRDKRMLIPITEKPHIRKCRALGLTQGDKSNILSSATNNRCVLIPHHTSLDLVGDFTLEWFVTFITLPAQNTDVMAHQNTGTTSGWWFQVLPDTPQFRFRMYDSSGTLVTTSAAIVFEAGETYHVVASRSGTTDDERLGLGER